MDQVAKPLLLIDVDGPLNPYAAKPTRRPAGYTTHRMNPLYDNDGRRWTDVHRKPLRVWLNHDHGAQLKALPYDLVWATTWRHEANEFIGPHIGLPELPYIDFAHTSLHTRSDGTYFKTHEIVEYAAGRPFAWLDDEISDWDTRYVEEKHSAPALLHRVNPRDGLTVRDFNVLAEWAESL